jgi:hypothetical protein
MTPGMANWQYTLPAPGLYPIPFSSSDLPTESKESR